MVNTERVSFISNGTQNYNILNIVVNTEQSAHRYQVIDDYNILNIVVNTEHRHILLY